MKKIYIIFFSFVITSCAARISYLGSSSVPTQQVDVYVDESSIIKKYDVIGKGYPAVRLLNQHNINKLQNNSIEVAKAKGADAVIIKDYYIPYSGTSIQTTSKADSVGRGIIAVSNTNIQSTSTTAFTIYFLKYK